MLQTRLAVLSAVLRVSPAFAMDELISQPSAHSVKATLDKLESLAQARFENLCAN